MKDMSIAGRSYRLTAAERDGHWVARAEHVEMGALCGLEGRGSSAAEAIDRLSRWLEWQAEHAAALEALRDVERAYHRAVATSAFASDSDRSTSVESRRASLQALDAARLRLDDIRSRMPEDAAQTNL